MQIYCILLIKLLFLVTSVQAQQLFFYSTAQIFDETGNLFSVLSGVSENEYQEQTLRLLSDSGYLAASVDSVRRLNSSLDIFVTRGPKFAMFIRLMEDPNTLLDEHNEAYFTSISLEDYIRSKLASAENRGFAFAQIHVKEFQPDYTNHRVEVSLRFESGEKMLIHGLRFNGLRQLSDSFLSREAGFIPNQPHSPLLAERYKNRIQSSFFIRSAALPYLENRDGRWWYVMDIQETTGSHLDVVLGYNPSSSINRSLLGRGELELRNFISEGSVGGIVFDRVAIDRSRLGLMFHQHWALGYPVMLGFDAAVLQQDSTWYSAGGTFTGAYSTIGGFKIGLQGIVNSVRTSASTQVVADAGFAGFRGFLEYNDTDRRFAPTRGTAYRITAERGVKTIQTTGSANLIPKKTGIIRYSAEIQTYFKLTESHLITPRIHAAHSFADVFMQDDLFRFGGHQSLRGYREEQLAAIAFSWADLEYRFRLDEDSFLFGFSAAGIYTFTNELAQLNYDINREIVYSMGFGISYRVAPGILTFSYAVSPDDRIGNGKVHFGIQNRF